MSAAADSGIAIAWSGGKDCTSALHAVSDSGRRAAALFATLETNPGVPRRVAMHGTPETLLRRQAGLLGLPLTTVAVPRLPDNDTYKAAFAEGVAVLRARGVGRLVFGDLFLADLREWREALCAEMGITPEFPLWGRDTGRYMEDFLDLGFRARVTCVDATRLDPGLCGAELDADFLQALPAGVDPAGERGEFHTFVYAGPGFRRPAAHRVGAAYRAGDFVYCELEEETTDDG